MLYHIPRSHRSDGPISDLIADIYSVYIYVCVCDKLRRIGRVVERARNFDRGGVGFDSRQSLSHPFLAYIELREAKNGDPQQCQCSPNCV